MPKKTPYREPDPPAKPTLRDGLEELARRSGVSGDEAVDAMADAAVSLVRVGDAAEKIRETLRSDRREGRSRVVREGPAFVHDTGATCAGVGAALAAAVEIGARYESSETALSVFERARNAVALETGPEPLETIREILDSGRPAWFVLEGTRMYFDPAKNPREKLDRGEVVVDVTPPPPAEAVTIPLGRFTAFERIERGEIDEPLPDPAPFVDAIAQRSRDRRAIAPVRDDRPVIPTGSLRMLFPEPIETIEQARSLVRELLRAQPHGHDLARAKLGGCVCRWCRAHRFVEGR